MSQEISQRVLSEVYQILKMLPDEKIERIPERIRNVFLHGNIDTNKYPVDIKIPIEKQELDKDTYAYVYMLMNYVVEDVKYENVEPDWNSYNSIEEKVQMLENEIITNFFNINNKYADKNMTDKKYVLNFYYFGLTDDEENKNILTPFIALDKVFIIMYNELREDKNYEKALKNYKYVSEELKLLISNI